MFPLLQVLKIIRLWLNVLVSKLFHRNMTGAVNYKCSLKWLPITLTRFRQSLKL